MSVRSTAKYLKVPSNTDFNWQKKKKAIALHTTLILRTFYMEKKLLSIRFLFAVNRSQQLLAQT